MKTLIELIQEKLRLGKDTKIDMYNISSFYDFINKYDVQDFTRQETIFCTFNIKNDLIKKITKQIASNHDKLYTDVCEFIETTNKKDLDDYSYVITDNKSNSNYIRIKNKNTTYPILLGCVLSVKGNPNIQYAFYNGLDKNEIERLEIILLNIVDFIINYNK